MKVFLIVLTVAMLQGCAGVYQMGTATSTEAQISEFICDFSTERQRQTAGIARHVRCP